MSVMMFLSEDKKTVVIKGDYGGHFFMKNMPIEDFKKKALHILLDEAEEQ
ncbi:hypothetical protein FP74_gp004 [Bacillus phage CAM003]|uniref:Uncharacterized protein n=4 Tax=Bastillevirus TaxID=1918010 RepID=A0A024AZZ0_9CAUD|nr:hypothetical protein FP73_gp004 [Bacillus phage Hoody T]YP_009035527.1 hypothetical protein FP76_gp006 [Bacillus phage Evoli]YP_009036907.1 hypothetical protein FP74_gp004 [Bacillus phage CAM003]ASU00853.1 hypothetical protein ANTHONY_6 [Bacillus phage Anthony]AHZ09441.1 hypothetical protein [Bacillus phage CAM003]AHZ09730.1 hypothetical protein [Bacillus phage Evoli]AHZ10316.1 hypothetical protein [Bacillus phage Hoody T]